MSLVFTAVYRFFARFRTAFFLLFGIAVAAILYTGLKINIVEDISKVLPMNEKVSQFLKVVNQSAFADELVVFVGPADGRDIPSKEELIRFADTLAGSLQDLVPEMITRTRVKTEDTAFREVYREIRENLPLFLEEEDYRRLDSLTSEGAINQSVRSVFKTLQSPAGIATRDILLGDPLGLTGMAMNKLAAFRLDESYTTYDGYIFSADHQYLLLFITPAQKSTETAKNGVMLRHLDERIQKTGQQFNGRIRAGYFGTTAVSVANAQQLKRDIILTMNLAIVLLVLFIGYYFGKFRVIPAIVVTTLMSAGLSIAVLALLNREISAVSLGFGAVLLGIAIAYTIHYLNHIRDLKDPQKVLKEIALPIIMSSVISSGDFFTLLLVRSEAVRDLGLFAGFSILAAGLFTLLILPHLTGKINWENSRENLVNRSVRRLASFPIEKKRWVVPVILVLTIVFFFTSRRVSFESDLTGMSYMNDDLKSAEATLDQISQFSLRSVYVVTRGNDEDEALGRAKQLLGKVDHLRQEGLVKKLTTVTSLAVTEDEAQIRTGRWQQYWTAERRANLREHLLSAARENGFKASGFDPFFQWLETDFEPVTTNSLPALKHMFLDPFISRTDSMATVTTILKVKQEDKPALYEALNDEQASFVFDKQFLTSAFMDILNEDFGKLVLVSMLIVFVVLLVSYGRIELAVITFIPMLISWVWTLGIMGLLGMKLNIFNIIITSFVFGLGIDYAIFSIQGMLQQYKNGSGDVNAFRSSVLMDAITTLIGLGVLILAVHPALKAMALAAIIGILSVWFITWSLEPVLFNWLMYNGKNKRPEPVTYKDFLYSIGSLAIFGLLSLVNMIFGILIFKILRLKSKRARGWFHYMLMITTKMLNYVNIETPKRISLPEGEDLRRPAVIIANHQSHIDISLVLMLHPRLIELTNDRVQGSRFYGLLIRMANFYAVSEGMEALSAKLRPHVDDGYSVLIFPEGTRSPDNRIRRFHKGAFYLAEELGIDLLPVIIHGSGAVMAKGEYFLRAGRVNMKFLPRIKPGDKRFGSSLLEKSRGIRLYMAEEYEQLAKEVETPSYFRKKLINNYIYKGPVLEWYLKVKIRLEKNYELFDRNLPRTGRITDIGCGYGFLCYMLSFLSEERKITGIDYDPEKIATAKNCPAANDRVEFLHGDALKVELPESKAFILADVLHYFPEDEQEMLIVRCIEKLENEGTLIIRDADRQMGKKHFGTRLSEFFSTNIGFNKTMNGKKELYFTSREKIMKILEERKMNVEIVDESKMTSNIIFIARKFGI